LKIEDDRERRRRLEAYLDKGVGECHLRRPEIGALVHAALRFHHGRCYELLAWCVMPNHVHLLLKLDTTPMSKIVAELKRYTARESNTALRRQGALWAEDYWDTFMRDSQHQLKARRYIENNPVKAYLVRDPKEWAWSSSRFRDQRGALCL